jgi:competence protein ComEA
MVDSRGGRLVTYLVAGALMLALGVRLFGGSAAPPPAPVEFVRDADTSGQAEERVWVDIAGAVRRPGLYRVPASARVGQVIDRAGGLRGAATAAVNLAGPVQDGQQIVVAGRETGGNGAAAVSTAPETAADTPSADSSSDGPAQAATGSLSLATATAAEIDAAAEGIGPTLAARIVEVRAQGGGFDSVDDLRQVPGIGEVRFQALARIFGP